MTKWSDEEIRRMEEDEDYWDHSGAPERIEPSPPERRGSVFAVRFTAEQARLVGQAAEAAGISPLDFIRDAAVQRATPIEATTRVVEQPRGARASTVTRRRRARSTGT